jgi:acyl-CoA synthetase (AMP-forming)/AMP-acid ligase II
MAKYKIPKYYRIVDDIPKTTLGKPDLQKCREILLEK